MKLLYFFIILSFPSISYSFSQQSSLHAVQKSFLGSRPTNLLYQETTQAFLDHAGVKENIICYSLQPSPFLDSLFGMKNILGFTTLTGIWLNEQELNRLPDCERLFTIAHEVAHFILQHPAHLIAKGSFIVIAAMPSFIGAIH